MTRHPEGYDNWRAVEMAIKSAAIRAHEADPRLLVSDLIRQAYYDRFLTRVFWEGEASQWVLKGGGGMLARVPNARRTLDADLYHEGYTADQEVADLRRVADRDLGDFFRFVYTSHRVILAHDIQPYTEGYRVIFEARLGPKPGDTIKVDLSTHVGATDAVTVAEPANRLPVAKLVTAPYRLYPVVNQVADKLCATITEYHGKPSSREKDLVDLVIIALTQPMPADRLREAIITECRKRHLAAAAAFMIPSTWGKAYPTLARNTTAQTCDLKAAASLMAQFLDPVLGGSASGMWHPQTRAWQ